MIDKVLENIRKSAPLEKILDPPLKVHTPRFFHIHEVFFAVFLPMH